MAVSDYPNGRAPHDALILCENMWVDPILAPEIRFVAKYCRDRGVTFRGNQGYRWIGNASDYQVGYDDYRTGRDRSDSLDFGASQYYVAGVAGAGGPSASRIGWSNHGFGTACDVGSEGPNWQAVRDEAFRLMGWIRDVPGESWHYHKVRPRDPSIDMAPYQNDTEPPTPPEHVNEMEKLMSLPILYADTQRIGILGLLTDQGWIDIPVSSSGAAQVRVALATSRKFFPDEDKTVYVNGEEFIAWRALFTDGAPEKVRLEQVSADAIKTLTELVPGL